MVHQREVSSSPVSSSAVSSSAVSSTQESEFTIHATIARLRVILDRHYLFLLILILFVSFRLLAILLFRPGGFIADASDYDFYYAWGLFGPRGKHVFDNMWTAYPPLFAAIMLQAFELSSRIAPWVDPRLWFHTIFGSVLLFFETGNLVLIYRLAGKLTDRNKERHPFTLSPFHPVTSALLYALLFTPVYTMLGWFEPLPLFFMLLGLDLLLGVTVSADSNAKLRTGGSWLGSAIAAALGFLIKLTPILLVPIAVRWLGAKLSWQAARTEWLNLQSPGNLLRATVYSMIFLAVVIGVGYPLVSANPALAFSSFRVQSIRPPWQSIWALIDGYYAAGIVPLRMDNLIGLQRPLWESSIPWGLVTVAFLGLYLWLYTRPYDWTAQRTPITFAAVSVILLFCYSKGWSPQFLVWVLAFIVLLLPTLRGVLIAVTLSIINVVEAQVYLILLNHEVVWLLWLTVLLRSLLLALLAVEFLGQIWPARKQGIRIQRMCAALTWGVMGIAVISGGISVPRVAQAYTDRMFAAHPCRDVIIYLRAEALWPNRTIASEQIAVWRDLYPWLRDDYEFRILDSYSPVDRDPAVVVGEQLDELTNAGEVWWMERPTLARHPDAPAVADSYFARQDVHLLDRQHFGDCLLQRVVRADKAADAVADVVGGPIRLVDVAHTSGTAGSGAGSGADSGADSITVGADLHLVLYWLADASVGESYTVFTQLLDGAGTLVAQQDNLPVVGLAPTNTWQPKTIIRDPYRLTIPPTATPGTYQLRIGLYDSEGRRPLTLPDGTVSDHLALTVNLTYAP